ncbi:MAG: F0F1 ATP synthase subunit epsilon [Pseudomonadota bacterium]
MKKSTGYRLEIITPERIIPLDDIVFTVVQSGNGPVGILPEHAPLLGVVKTGALKIRDGKQEFYAFVRAGFFMISHEGVSIVVRSAEVDAQIDVKRAMAAKDRATQIITNKQQGWIWRGHGKRS